jgi:CheY-like chemotaxis protein
MANKRSLRASRLEAESSRLLFTTLAEQVKLPFVTVKHAAELLRAHPNKDELERLLQTIALTSSSALKLIDNYLLSVSLLDGPQLIFEPVSLSSVMYDVAHSLDSYAKAHDCELELRLAGKFGPVMARREVVQAALESLGYSFIDAASRPEASTKVTLAARRTIGGMSTGVYSDMSKLNSGLLKQAKTLKGVARQPLSEFSAGSGAGVFVADALFDYLKSPVRVARFQGLFGLAATLLPSNQLSLV